MKKAFLFLQNAIGDFGLWIGAPAGNPRSLRAGLPTSQPTIRKSGPASPVKRQSLLIQSAIGDFGLWVGALAGNPRSLKKVFLFLHFMLFITQLSLQGQKLDSLWGEEGFLTQSLGTGAENSLFTQAISEDRFIVVGSNLRYRFSQNLSSNDPERLDVWIRCFDREGNLIETFGEGGTALLPLEASLYTSRISKLAIDKKGRIYLSGLFNHELFICRLLPNGKKDQDFASQGIFQTEDLEYVTQSGFHIGPSGNLFIIGAYSQRTAQETQIYLASLSEDGVLRQEWGKQGVRILGISLFQDQGSDLNLHSLHVFQDGRMWIGGGNRINSWIVQLTPAGLIDSTFGENGFVTSDSLPAIFSYNYFWPLAEDTILISANKRNNDLLGFLYGCFTAVNRKGEIIRGFGENGVLLPPAEIPIPSNPPTGLIQLATNSYAAILKDFVFKFDQNGKLDSSFGFNGFQRWQIEGRSTSVSGIFPASDTSFFIAGKTGATNYIGKIRSDGNLDPAFESTGFFSYLISDGSSIGQIIHVDEQGRIWNAGKSWQFRSSDPTMTDFAPLSFMSKFLGNGENVWNSQKDALPSGIDFADFLQLKGGSTLAIGDFNSSFESFAQAFLPDGRPDSLFGTNSLIPLPPGKARASMQSPDGKLYVFGNFPVNSFLIAPAIICYDAKGQVLQNDFGKQGIATQHLPYTNYSLAPSIQTDSKKRFLVGGIAYNAFFLMRFLPNGDPDTSFGINGFASSPLDFPVSKACAGFILQENDQIVMGGYSGEAFVLAAYQENGKPDSTFGEHGKAFTYFPDGDARAYAITKLPDGRILLGGNYQHIESKLQDLALACYQPNGQLDSTFGEDGILILDAGGAGECIYDMHVNPDSSILLAGHSSDRMLIVKLLPQLQLDLQPHPEASFPPLLLYPNPLHSEAKLRYTLSHAQRVRIRLLSLSGQEVAVLLDEPRLKGAQEELLRLPEGLARGGYVLALEAQEGRQAIKVLIK